MIDRRKFVLAGTAFSAALAVQPAFAMKPQVYVKDGAALGGTDTVAYFDGSGPVAGLAENSAEWMGATWYFSTAANKEKFEADPEAFAPKYGGYCAYAVSKGATAPTDPEAWTIFEDRLYLNFSVDVRSIWQKDIPGNISKADKNWPDVLA